MEPIPKRFASVSENEVANVLQDRVPKATKSSTSTWVAVTEYLKANDASCELKTCTRIELDDHLCKCYVSMKRNDGKNYPEPSYYGFRAAIHRQLVELERNFNVYSDPEFRKSNNVLDGVLKKLRREGKKILSPHNHHHSSTTSKELISKEPMLCSMSLNKMNKVTQLQLKTTKSVSCLNVRVLCYVEVACLEYRPYM